jgi:hypothetical protein
MAVRRVSDGKRAFQRSLGRMVGVSMRARRRRKEEDQGGGLSVEV